MNKEKLTKDIEEMEDTLTAMAEELFAKTKTIIEELSKKRQKLAEIEFGMKVGSVICYEGRYYKITRFETFWPVGRLVKKDGSVANKESHLHKIQKLSFTF